ncbi:MAG: VWA domain-containing protein [Pirellulaceae bacterium]|nr:VWA domain-containing protein [Pirellulaceae bacterium]MDP7015795.1 VWA domain-containing protein [Pirellulaceae bacterium]
MPYSREISRDHKGCVLFLLDQSYSMVEPLGGSQKRKCDELVFAVNGWLHNMAIRASGDVGIRDWLDVGVIGYRTDQQATPIIEPSLVGPLAGRPLVSVTDIGNHPARIETSVQQIRDDETGELLEIPSDNPIWVEPKAEGSTPMCHVLHYAYGILENWIREHPASFPPIVIHITDGESQDSDPRPYAEAVRALATQDGNVLLFNCHLSMTNAAQCLFPSSDAALPDELAKVLFEMSSPLPRPFFESAVAEGLGAQPGARGMAFNADMVVLVKFLDMGTRAAVMLR